MLTTSEFLPVGAMGGHPLPASPAPCRGVSTKPIIIIIFDSSCSNSKSPKEPHKLNRGLAVCIPLYWLAHINNTFACIMRHFVSSTLQQPGMCIYMVLINT